MPRRKNDEESGAKTSLKVFRSFIKKDSNNKLNADNVVSKECFTEWIRTRKGEVHKPEKAFQKSLSAHLAGSDGRKPFPPEEEKAVLETLRRKKPWPCFKGGDVQYGKRGYRAMGFHEKRAPSAGLGSEHVMSPSKLVINEDDDSSSESIERTLSKRQRRSSSSSQFASRDKLKKHDDCSETGSENAASSSSSIAMGSTTFEAASETIMSHHLLQDLDDNVLRWFYMNVSTMMQRMIQNGSHPWEVVTRVLRYVLISLGRTEPGDENLARQVFESRCREFPDDMILFLDTLSPAPEARIHFQNRRSAQFHGWITRDRGGVHRSIFPVGSLIRVFATSMRAWWRPKVHFGVDAECLDAAGTPHPVTVFFQTNPEINHICVRMRLRN